MPEPVFERRRMKQDRVRQEMQEKYERSLFTPSGIKVFRLQPSIDNSSIRKYQLRTSNTGSSRIQSPRDTSTPYTPAHPEPRTDSVTSGTRTCQTMRSIGTQTSLEKADSRDAVRDKPPCPVQRPGSSLGNRSVTYHPRSASCQPSHLYQLNQRSNNREHEGRARSADRTKCPRRFDGSPVEIPGFMRNNGFLHHEDLNLGQKQYIWGVARIYSVTQLMKLKQRQYQSLLDHEFSKRIQNKDLKEHERLREWKEYLRYSKFIKCYEQRIPRCKSRGMRSPCEEASHIHKHMIKGWTTDPSANDAYRPLSRTSSNSASFQPALSPTERCGSAYEQSTDDETEHYALKLVILPGDRERSPSDNVSETDLKEEKEGQQSKNSAAHVDSAGNSFQDVEDTEKAEPSTVEGNFL